MLRLVPIEEPVGVPPPIGVLAAGIRREAGPAEAFLRAARALVAGFTVVGVVAPAGPVTGTGGGGTGAGGSGILISGIGGGGGAEHMIRSRVWI
jgi:hypothetical protein